MPPSLHGRSQPPDPPDLSNVPGQYHDLGEVFSKQHALSFTPHCPYDCGITLLHGTPLPTNRLFNLSHLKQEAPTLLGVCNFYRQFIHNSSKVVAPLTRLTSTLKCFQWSEEAEAAFSRLKTLFTSAPIHSHPDPSHQFIVEVDASDTSVGAILW